MTSEKPASERGDESAVREWWLSWDMFDRYKSAFHSKEAALRTYPEVPPIHVREVLPGEIAHRDAQLAEMRAMLKEARWLLNQERGQDQHYTRREMAWFKQYDEVTK